MAIDNVGRVLAIDYGQKRTGVAVTDMLRISANPLATIDTATLMDWLKEYLSRGEVDIVVIGCPRKLNGENSDSMLYILPFVEEFRRVFTDIPLVEYDERFTSTLAHRVMIDGGMSKKKRMDKTVVDKIAATIILEDYLESTRYREHI